MHSEALEQVYLIIWPREIFGTIVCQHTLLFVIILYIKHLLINAKKVKM